MSRMSLPRAQAGGLLAALACAVLLASRPAAQAGHEVNYYPSFYPQEIRIEPLDPQSAAKELGDNTLHAYIGTAPHFSGEPPAHLKSVVSLRSFIIARANQERLPAREARCRVLAGAVTALGKTPDVVAHSYPVTPHHADYLGHVDLIPQPKQPHASNFADAEIAFEEVEVDELLRGAGVLNTWTAPPWAKEGWFQVYHLLRPTLGDPAERDRADALYEQRTRGEFRDPTERLNLERALVAALTNSCERTVIGYRLRREFYNDDFSNGVENILVDSHSGFNSPILLRTIKLKDFPWNGWLRIGTDHQPKAAWNPVAGFTDAGGRLVWSIVGDSAFLPIPHSSGWVPNRVEIRDHGNGRQSIRVPADALMPQSGSGRLRPVGSAQGAMGKVTYRVLASSFHDGSEMEPADVLYPYAFAFRWGAKNADGVFDADVAAATQLVRERLKGVRILQVEEKTLTLADLAFTYRSPIVEVYLDQLTADQQTDALLAPPWSTVPWHVLALLEAAVERGIGAFSQSEAQRRGVPWLDLVRVPEQRANLLALVKEFAVTGYRPAALVDLVSSDDARARWEKLEKFAEASGHLLVTNGPYRLTSATPEAFVLEVVREFTYPIGIGTFDAYAYPPRALITGIERAGDRIVVAADVEVAVKQQRHRRVVRTPLKRDSTREIYPIRPVVPYVIVGRDRKIAAAGNARWQTDGRFAVPLPELPPGSYNMFTALFLDGNTLDPSIGHIDFRKD